MKVLPSESEVLVFGETKEIDFKVKHDSKVMIDILANKLYSDKVSAVIRELVTNAREVSDEIVIDLIREEDTLYFLIRDFGPGLTEEEIHKTFCQFLWSTKDESDDFIGGYGLGAKTPFALTNQFFVVSYKDGIKTKYRIYYDDSYEIKYEILSQEPTDKRNGLAIKVPIPESSEWSFKRTFGTAIREIMIILSPLKKLTDLAGKSYSANSYLQIIDKLYEDEYVEVYLTKKTSFEVFSSLAISKRIFNPYGSNLAFTVIIKKPNQDYVSIPADRESVTVKEKLHNIIDDALKPYNDLGTTQINLYHRSIKSNFESSAFNCLSDLLFTPTRWIVLNDKTYLYLVNRRPSAILAKATRTVGKTDDDVFIGESQFKKFLNALDSVNPGLKEVLLSSDRIKLDLLNYTYNPASKKRASTRKYKVVLTSQDEYIDKKLTVSEFEDLLKELLHQYETRTDDPIKWPVYDLDVSATLLTHVDGRLYKQFSDLMVTLRSLKSVYQNSYSSKWLIFRKFLFPAAYRMYKETIETIVPNKEIASKLLKFVDQFKPEPYILELDHDLLRYIPKYNPATSIRSYVYFIDNIIQHNSELHYSICNQLACDTGVPVSYIDHSYDLSLLMLLKYFFKIESWPERYCYTEDIVEFITKELETKEDQ